MKSFSYIVQDALGIHARPATLLVKAAAQFHSTITLNNSVKQVDAKRMIAVMAMAVKQGQEVTITAEGDDEKEAIEALELFFQNNL
ncbi:HPr family phosphocarrier protein [Anaerocolumna chitinilytica]|uniref:Phosphocarrier protein HPr n=1 Tax=Anaerocolumna chitinilytica TaxID=1727145 RepID=A0A7I8DJY4_9FIRM|nr:HPr family phosphocarrier protein [Anaerocolumna chitinilytica]BCJ98642.1 phosphocarrier protein HPr [Anaerocolumna chitinilytica]